MALRFLGAALIAAVLGFGAWTASAMQRPGPDPAARYEIAAAAEGGVLKGLDVTLQFAGDADGQSLLVLPNAWGGEEELWRAISDLAVEGGVLKDGAQPQFKLIDHTPGAALTVRYRVASDPQTTRDVVREDRYRPQFRDSFGSVLGNAAFVRPSLPDDARYSVRFAPPPQPWRFASDLEHAPTLNEDELIGSVIIVGDFELLTPKEGPANLRFAMGKGFGFSGQDLADKIGGIVRAQRAFWRSAEGPYFVALTPFAPSSPGQLSIGGTGLDDAFSLYSTTSVPLARMTRILAHESLHTWIPGRIGAMPDGDAERSAYFISEGFTEFMTDRLLVRSGAWGPEQFAESFNTFAFEYAASSEKNAPNSRIQEAFWRDPAVQRLPYTRGRLFAEAMDGDVRRATRGRQSFSDVLFAMQPRAATQVVDNLVRSLRDVGVTVRPSLDRFIERGEAIVLPVDLFAPCGRLEEVEGGPFALGFEIAGEGNNPRVVANLDPKSNAYAAGLRDGMQLQMFSASLGDPMTPAQVVVRHADGREESFSYLPQDSRRRFMFQRLVLADLSLPQVRASCVARLSGQRVPNR